MLVDTYEKLDVKLDVVEYVVHMADVHIRLTQRHDEYREVFSRVYKEIKKTPANTAILCAGDIFHSKVDLSPEAVQLASEFLKNCANLRPTVIVAGNHDCYSGDHELLTRGGWINIAKYVNSNSTDEVATFNVDTQEMEFQSPSGLIKKKFAGELINLVGKNVDLLVTPTHQVLYHWNSSGKYYKKNAIDVTRKSEIPINGRIQSFVPDSFYKLLGFSFAEGTFVLRDHIQNSADNKFDGCRVQFHLKCKREIEYLSNTLTELNYEFKLRPQKDGSYYIVVYSDLGKKICKYFDTEKEIPVSIISASLSQMRSFLDGYLHGDENSVGLNGKWRFSSISEKSIDILHTLIRLVGGRSNRNERIIYGNYKNSRRQYLCSAFIDNKVHFSPVQKTLKVPYSGYVYCVGVPNTNLFVRRGKHISVCGNCLLTNVTRLDSITPVAQYLDHKNLFYLKESKLYGLANILINNMSVFDDNTSFIKMKNVTKKIKNAFDTKIALFHGGVFSAKTEVGYVVTNRSITNNMFDGHDIAMLGDIHLAQDLQQYNASLDNPIIRYSGSLLQQNHGENLLGHGFTLWNVKDRTYTHVEIPNDYGYFTIDIDDGKLITDIVNMPKKPKLRVRCKESIAMEVKKVVAEIRKTHEITDLIYMRVDDNDTKRLGGAQAAANLSQITNVDYQNKLITDYLKAKYGEVMDDETLESVHQINKDLNANVNKEQSRSIRWRPIKFEFSNMFSYGEDNILDFTKLTDVYGLFAANASGKSSLMDALCFTIFDKSARAFKATHVINSQKMSFSGKFTFEINNVTYIIERGGSRDKKNNIKVEVNFYSIEKGVKTPLNSEARRSTNEIIRDYLGSYDDFVLTSLALQGNQGSLIEMGQTERKELLSQFIGLNIFDRLDILASDKLKELGGVIKMFNKESNQQKIDAMKNDLCLLESKLLDLNSQKGNLTFQKQKVDGQIIIEQAKIVTLENVPLTVVPMKKEKVTLEEKIAEMKEDIAKIDVETRERKKEYDGLMQKMLGYSPDLKEKFDSHEKLTHDRQRIDNDIEKLKALVQEKLKKLEHLDKHEYDPNCKFCCNNIFVKDAVATRESLTGDRQAATELFTTLTTVKVELMVLEPLVAEYKDLLTTKERSNTLAAWLSKKELDKVNATTLIDKHAARIAEIDEQIELYERSKEVIEANKMVDVEIQRLSRESAGFGTRLRTINDEYMEAYSRKVSFTDQVKNIEQQVTDIEKCEIEQTAYEYYLSAIGKDGVPYNIISDAVPRIEQEVNNILSQIVDFSISIETDGKNVNVYIKYEDKKWPLELCSGMERFVAALALRVALINISNLPRPNFLVVDEGFSALDSTNISMVHSLFDYLKTNFDFIIVISHLDVMRDMVDKQLEIKKENGFSKIDNTV